MTSRATSAAAWMRTHGLLPHGQLVPRTRAPITVWRPARPATRGLELRVRTTPSAEAAAGIALLLGWIILTAFLVLGVLLPAASLL